MDQPWQEPEPAWWAALLVYLRNPGWFTAEEELQPLAERLRSLVEALERLRPELEPLAGQPPDKLLHAVQVAFAADASLADLADSLPFPDWLWELSGALADLDDLTALSPLLAERLRARARAEDGDLDRNLARVTIAILLTAEEALAVQGWRSYRLADRLRALFLIEEAQTVWYRKTFPELSRRAPALQKAFGPDLPSRRELLTNLLPQPREWLGKLLGDLEDTYAAYFASEIRERVRNTVPRRRPPRTLLQSMGEAWKPRNLEVQLGELAQRVGETREAVSHILPEAPPDCDLESAILELHLRADPALAENLANALPPESFATLQCGELDEIARSRRLRGVPDPPAGGSTCAERAHNSRLIGLAFSGGGIRSATFNLGVLQAISRLGMLRACDYLSTVSGGGYIGGWLCNWLYRSSQRTVRRGLDPRRAPDPRNAEQRPIQFLRDYSNYLTPKAGFFSADTWTLIVIWLRNTLLNQTVLVSALAALLLLPRVFVKVAFYVAINLGWWEVAICGVLVAAAAVAIGRNLRGLDPADPGGQRYSGFEVGGLILAPVLLAAILGSAAIWSYEGDLEPLGLAFGAILLGALFLLGQMCGFRDCFALAHPKWERLAPAWLAAACVLAAGVGLLVFRAGVRLVGNIETDWGIVTCGPPLLIVLLSAVLFAFVGLLGIYLPDERREWLSRFQASLWILTLGWLALFGVALQGPLLLESLWEHYRPALSGVSVTWLATTLWGVLGAKSAATGPAEPGRGRTLQATVLNAIVVVAPYVFAAGLVLLVSLGLSVVIDSGVSSGVIFALAVVLSLVLGSTVDTNEFSMHHFYKNRLVRCYLGASHLTRRPSPYTGFDPRDDVELSSLTASRPSFRRPPYEGPYPVVNVTLNLVHGRRLAWQQRKAASFVFTPRRSGFEYQDWELLQARYPLFNQGYRPTIQYGYARGGIHVGSAIAISGAAASPNMGYHSSPAAAFLMTFFNVRLGWWLGNPRHQGTFRRSGTLFGPLYLFKELLGLTDDRAQYVYLSDGGHFENLGLYELVRRRCRYIVVCDAEEDPELHFGGLAGAIRKCRTDLGVEIDLDVERLKPPETGSHSPWHCVVGTIFYRDGPPGTVVYLKSSISGDEPVDVLEYQARNPAFPHQSTGDQWFDESQFESYRRLGLHIAEHTFHETAHQHSLIASKESFFTELRQRWYPPSSSVEKAFSRHGETLSRLMDRLIQEPHLRFLDAQIYPEWERLMTAPPPTSTPGLPLWLPATYEERRSGFYFCHCLIQLMENVYLDLNLEREAEHPDNSGWINLFRHWFWSGMFRVTWAIASYNYGSRFRSFCGRKFDMAASRVVRTEATSLNFWEEELLRRLPTAPDDEICQFQIEVTDPTGGPGMVQFPVGLAVIDAERNLVYFRIQDHVRHMGLAQRAMKLLRGHVRGIAWRAAPRDFPEESTRDNQRRLERFFRSL
jgi:hypothetical protein